MSGRLVQARGPSAGALDDLGEGPDQGSENVVGVQNNRTDFRASVSPSSDQPSGEILVPDQQLGSLQPDRPSRARHARSPGTYENTEIDLPTPANSNTPTEGQPKPRRARKRRKSKRSDLRLKAMTLAIPWELYEQGSRAYGNAPHHGIDLDCLVTLRPEIMVDLDPEQREAWFRAQVNKIRTMYAANDNLPEFACLWSRESRRIGTAGKYEGVGEHIHLLLPAGGRFDILKGYFKKHLRGQFEVDVTAASNLNRRLRNGQIGNASTYVLKAVEPAYWRAYPQTPHRASGPIYGQRVGWSLNLLDEQPVGRKARPRRAG